MADRRDKVDIPELSGIHQAEDATLESEKGPSQPFLSVWFRCCHVYGRLNRNLEQTKYIGRCPKCGAQVQALIGPDGTNQRLFEAY